MDNYKGIYYNERKDLKLYEGGAHFKYNALFNILLSLGGFIEDDKTNDFNNNSYKKDKIKQNKDIDSLLIKVKGKQSKYKTRNFHQLNYINNPNTQIRQNSQYNLKRKHSLTLKDYNAKKNNMNNFLNKKLSYSRRNINSISINDDRYKNIINNNLIQILFQKKEKRQKSEEKKNCNNNKNNQILDYLKYSHNKYGSENIENTNNALINKIRTLKKYYTANKSFFINLNNKSVNNRNKNINSLEINGRDNNKKNDKQELITVKKNKYPLIYDKNKISLLKGNAKLSKHLSFFSNNINKKSRNIFNKKIINYNTEENNKNNEISNYFKKKNNINLCNTYENSYKKENNIEYKANSKNISSYNNNLFKSINIKNKEKILKSNGNNFIIQKYIRKKINQICIFSQKDCKINKGKIKKI